MKKQKLPWKCQYCGDIHTETVDLYRCVECEAVLCEESIITTPANVAEDRYHHFLLQGEICGPCKLSVRKVQCGSVMDALDALDASPEDVWDALEDQLVLRHESVS